MQVAAWNAFERCGSRSLLHRSIPDVPSRSLPAGTMVHTLAFEGAEDEEEIVERVGQQ